MFEKRLGDIIDDHCIKCRRVTNHAIVSLVNGEAAKVRCRTCYHDHDYRHEQAPPTKKELKKMEADALAAAEKQNSSAGVGDSLEADALKPGSELGLETSEIDTSDIDAAEMDAADAELEPLETAPAMDQPLKARRLKAGKA